MVDVSAIGSLLSSIDALKSIVQAGMDTRRAMLVDVELARISRQLREAETFALTAQKDMATALNRIQDLEQEVMRLRYRQDQKSRYHLQDVYLGAFAYVLKPEYAGGGPLHWLCQPCFEKGQNFVLQGRLQGRMKTWTCPSCKSEFQTNPSISPSNPFVPRART